MNNETNLTLLLTLCEKLLSNLNTVLLGEQVKGLLIVSRALSAWYDGRDWFNSLCKRVMEQDWSWNRPALDYLELYHAARKN